MALCKKSKRGIIYVVLYIDKNLMIGDSEIIADAITALKQTRLVLKIVEGLQVYLSYEVKFSTDKMRAFLG